jgi:hypothetical protein
LHLVNAAASSFDTYINTYLRAATIGGRTLHLSSSTWYHSQAYKQNQSMASDSSSTTAIPSSSILIAEKFTKCNYLLCLVQILPPIQAAQLEDLLTSVDAAPGKMIRAKIDDFTTEAPNPEYARWVSLDQALLGYLLSSMTCEVLMHVTTLPTSDEIWST